MLTSQLPELSVKLLSFTLRYSVPELVVVIVVDVPISNGGPLPIRPISDQQGRFAGHRDDRRGVAEPLADDVDRLAVKLVGSGLPTLPNA
jgi:hypothetical protein